MDGVPRSLRFLQGAGACSEAAAEVQPDPSSSFAHKAEVSAITSFAIHRELG